MKVRFRFLYVGFYLIETFEHLTCLLLMGDTDHGVAHLQYQAVVLLLSG